MKKCQKCELNYIQDNEEACIVCNPPSISKFKTEVTRSGQFKSKSKITEQMVEACYEYAKQYKAGRINIQDAVSKVAIETKMNKVSAHRMIYDSICGLFEGRKYASVMSKSATFWVLDKIREEHGEEKYQTALKATELHLNYYEQLPRGNAQREIRNYVSRNKAK